MTLLRKLAFHLIFQTLGPSRCGHCLTGMRVDCIHSNQRLLRPQNLTVFSCTALKQMHTPGVTSQIQWLILILSSLGLRGNWIDGGIMKALTYQQINPLTVHNHANCWEVRPTQEVGPWGCSFKRVYLMSDQEVSSFLPPWGFFLARDLKIMGLVSYGLKFLKLWAKRNLSFL